MLVGTMNGFGGCVDLATVLPILQLKMGHKLVTKEALQSLTRLSRAIDEQVNLSHRSNQPFVGMSAFAHKVSKTINNNDNNHNNVIYYPARGAFACACVRVKMFHTQYFFDIPPPPHTHWAASTWQQFSRRRTYINTLNPQFFFLAQGGMHVAAYD